MGRTDPHYREIIMQTYFRLEHHRLSEIPSFYTRDQTNKASSSQQNQELIQLFIKSNFHAKSNIIDAVIKKAKDYVFANYLSVNLISEYKALGCRKYIDVLKQSFDATNNFAMVREIAVQIYLFDLFFEESEELFKHYKWDDFSDYGGVDNYKNLAFGFCAQLLYPVFLKQTPQIAQERYNEYTKNNLTTVTKTL